MDKQHIILEQVTDTEKNINNLSLVMSDCMMNKYLKTCKISDCSNCQVANMVVTCVSNLALCDQLIVKRNASVMFNERKINIDRFNKRKRADAIAASGLLTVVATIIIALVTLCIIVCKRYS